MLKERIKELIEYSRCHLGVSHFDSIYKENELMHLLKIDSPLENTIDLSFIKELKRPDVLISRLKEDLKEELNIEGQDADLLIDEIFGILSLSNRELNEDLNKIKDLKERIDYFYDYSIKNNYVQKTAIEKSLHWDVMDFEHKFEISINLSKPEKSNADILKAKLEKAVSYPKCLLCKENLGFYGTYTKAPRRTIRFVPCKLDNEDFFFQFSPYGYFHEHLIVINEKHVPMTINKSTFKKLLDFVELYPHLFLGSNADLPIVGGSILAHEHFQGGNHALPVFLSKDLLTFKDESHPGVKISFLNWYNSVFKISSKNKLEVIEEANKIYEKYKNYSDESIDLISETNGINHSTITPIARMEEGNYCLYLILRNNRTNETYPEGIFHAHQEHHNIKKESIGLIEAMGLFILPGRLVKEMTKIEELLTISNYPYDDGYYKNHPEMEIHKKMIDNLIEEYGRSVNPSEVEMIIIDYINKTCKSILENTAIFKNNKEGDEALMRFVEVLNLK